MDQDIDPKMILREPKPQDVQKRTQNNTAKQIQDGPQEMDPMWPRIGPKQLNKIDLESSHNAT